MCSSIHYPVHVKRLVFVGLVFLSLVEGPFEHEATDMVGTEESDHLLLHILALKL